MDLSSFGASSLVGSGPRSLPTTARPVALLQPSFWVLCPLKRGVQMWMKQIWSISGEPQLLRYKVCWLTRCQDVGLGCTMSRSIVSSQPVSTLEKDPVDKQPTEKPETPAVGTDWVMVAENSHWAKMGWIYHAVGFTRRWGRDVATGWTAWWTGFFCRFWMIWMAQVLSSWCFSLVKPFSKVMIALICRKSFWLPFFYGGGFQRQLQNGLHAQAPVTLAPVPLVGPGLFGQSTEVAFPLPMTKRPLGDRMWFPPYQLVTILLTTC